VNTLLVDPPATQSSEQPTASSTPAAPPAGGSGSSDGADRSEPHAQRHVCAHCGTPLREDQQWCLHCGACEPGSLGEGPNLRPLTVLALTAAILALGAAVAVAAAIDEHGAAPRSATVALVPATTPTPTVPTTPAPTATTPATGGATSPHGSSKGSNLLFPPSSSTTKPPKVTAPTPTPKASGESGSTGESSGFGSGSTTTPSKTTTTVTGTSTTESQKSKEGSSGSSEPPTPILLDTDAATTYNPYNYPESGFGDPALAIDGEPSTAWTAQVQAHSFPNLAEGLLIDLREPTKLGKVELRTPTRGITVQVYGAGGAKAPTTITEPGWVLLSGSRTLKKTVTHLKLRTEGHAFRWLVVWIVKAPASAQGTPTAPGHVALSEVALYPPAPS
jgi:hypothetical protein